MATNDKKYMLNDYFLLGSNTETVKLFLPLALLIILFIMLPFYFFTKGGYEKHIQSLLLTEAKNLQLMRYSMVRDLELLSLDMQILMESESLKAYIHDPNPDTTQALSDRFYRFSRDRGKYYQIRYIDNNGQEKVRINFNGNQFEKVPEEQLQNKADRYYFKNSIILNRGDLYLSPLDLNVEHGQVEIPHKPVMRIAAPLYRDSENKPTGILILNYLAATMLNRYERVTPENNAGSYFILNQNGYWIKEESGQNEWGFMFSDGHSFAKAQPRVWDRLENQSTNIIETAAGFYLTETITIREELKLTSITVNEQSSLEEKWYLVCHIKSSNLGFASYLQNYRTIIIILALGLILSLIAAWYLAKRKIEKKSARKSVRLLSQGIEQSPAAVVITSMEGDILYVNPKFEEMSGYTYEEVRGQNPRLFKSGATSAEVYEDLWATICNKQTWAGEFENKDKDGNPYYVSARITPLLDKREKIEYFIGIQEDISERMRLQKILEETAITDSLTGAYNRGHFLVLCEQEIKRQQRYGSSVTLMLFDLDHFKNINDTYGHFTGDEVLKLFVSCISAELRETDVFGRLGGEEFAAMVVETDSKSALLLAERLRKSVENMVVLVENQEITVTVSIGLTQWQKQDEKVSDVLKRADNALYQAKGNGRNRVELL